MVGRLIATLSGILLGAFAGGGCRTGLMVACYLLSGAVGGRAAEPSPIRPIFCAVPLTPRRPADMSEKVTYQGDQPLYAQVRYGAEDSTLVILVVDWISRSQFDLYVDTDRDRIIEPQERVPGAGRIRRVELEAEFVQGEELRRVPRKVWFRLGRTGRTLSIATADLPHRRAQLAGQKVSVVRVDGDANGFFADRRDRLWIDRNGDGRWDPLREQFPYGPLLVLDGRRFAVRGDRIGNQIAFREVTQTGSLRLQWTPRDAAFRIEKLYVLVVGEDGAAFTLSRPGQTQAVPVGRYALEVVSLVVRSSDSDRPLQFVFTRIFGGESERWHSVEADQTVPIHPFGELRFELSLGDEETVKPGQDITVLPRLLTADGLMLNGSWFGQADRLSPESQYNAATVRLVDGNGRVLATGVSGFS